MRRFQIAILFIVSGALRDLPAQSAAPSVIMGRVIDERTAQPLSEVTVQVVGQEVVGTHLATLTRADGRYRLVNVRPGTVTIQVRRIGYTPKSITGLLVEPGKSLEQDVVLAPGSMELAAVVVSASQERATIAEALETQRLAPGLISGITRDAIARSPDKDAAAVVGRVSGIVVADDQTINSRGLGNRYTGVELNGSRMPSPDPEKKVVPLDLFPSSLLDGITVSKTFTPDQSGDFSGAMVQIKTRDFPADRTATYSLAMGLNTAMSGKTLPAALGVGGESLGFAGSGRALPGVVRAGGDLSSTTWTQRNQMINSFRNIWQPRQGGSQPNASMSATFGGNELVGEHRIGYIASGTYSLSREVHLNETRSLGRIGATPGEFVTYDAFNGMTGGTSTLWGGILNLSTLAGKHSQVRFNNTYTRTADNEARIERGVLEEYALPVRIELMNYVERRVWSSQFVFERETDANKLEFSVTGASVNRSQPDRSEFVQEIRTGAAGQESLLWMNSHPEAAVRTFAELDERSIESSLDFTRRLGGDGSTRSVKFGALGRMVDRDADNRAYSIFSASLTDDERALSPEVLFGGQFTQPNATVMQLRPLSQGGSYGANDYLGAAYGMFDGFISDRWRLTGGGRFEHSYVRVSASSTLGQPVRIPKSFDDVLPSAALTFSASNRHNLRLSLTRTLARPEYREIVPIAYRNVLADKNTVGNPDIVRTLIDNADVRWEFYPNRGELLSIGFFAKQFHKPIEAVAIASSGGGLETFVNAKGGTDLGLEIEARRNLRMIAGALEPITAFTNVTLMHSRIDLGNARTAATNPERAMVGQAPYIVNAGLAWTSLGNSKRSATLLFNRIGERISAAGENPLPDVIEDARSTLDLSLRFPLLRGLTGHFDAKNLLDAPMTERQGTVIREQYWTGRVFQAGITWR
jgi:hypothetical protein